MTRGEDGRLFIEFEPLNEWLTMIEAAGTAAAPGAVRELRPVRDDTFAVIGDAGDIIGCVEFIGSDDEGRARFLHNGRLARRHI